MKFETKDFIYGTVISVLLVVALFSSPLNKPEVHPVEASAAIQEEQPETLPEPEKPKEESTKYLSYQGAMIKHIPKDIYESQYSSEVIFCPKFKNISAKTITGIKFAASFKDGFGDEVYSDTGYKLTQKLAPASINTTDVFWRYENNQFEPGEPYDLLMPLIVGKTLKTNFKVEAITFSDGTLKEFI